MTDDNLPLLPLNLPSAPASPPPASKATAKKAQELPEQTVSAHGIAVQVHASELIVDDRFGLDAEELARGYEREIAAERARLYLGQPQHVFPLVTQATSGKYLVVTELPLALAAIALHQELGGSDAPVMVTVIVCASLDGDALLTSMFDPSKPRSLYERARYIAGCESRYGSRREWMRAENIDVQRWEPRFSKVSKINLLDEIILASIDPYSITNAEVAARIVDIWRNPEKQRVAAEILAQEVRSSNQPLKATVVFKKILDAFEAPKARPRFSDWNAGQRDLLGADGVVVATLTRTGDAWTLSGADVGKIDRAILGSAFEGFKPGP